MRLPPFPLATWAGLSLLAGCTVGPNYSSPKPTVPSQWCEPLAEGETSRTPALSSWWRAFQDPTLDSLLQRAMQANLDLRLAEARVREARAQYRIAAARSLPTLDAAGGYSRQRLSQHHPLVGALPLPGDFPFENNVYQTGFDAAWEIDVFGGARRAAEAGRAELAASELGRSHVLVTLLGEVARNYMEVRGCQRRLAIAHHTAQSQREVLALTRDRFEHELTSELDVQQATALLATTEATLPQLETAQQTGIHRLGVLLGQPPGALNTELNASAPLPTAPPEVPVGLPSDLLRRRPDVQQAERQLAAASARIGMAKAELFPKFSLTGAVGLQGASAGDWFTAGSRFWSAGPTVQWRIFDAGRLRANVKVQDARYEQTLAAYEKCVLLAFEEVENALVAYAKEQVRRRSLQQAAAACREAHRLATQLYANGLTSYLQVLDAQRARFRADDDLARCDQTLVQDLIALYKALGGGWEAQPSLTPSR